MFNGSQYEPKLLGYIIFCVPQKGQKNSKTVWLTTILKYFFIDILYLYFIHTMKVNGTQKHSVTNNLQNIFLWVPQTYNGSQWAPKTVCFSNIFNTFGVPKKYYGN